VVKKNDAENIDFSNLKPVIIRSVIKRKLRIAFKKPIEFLQSIFSGEKAA
jgi:hypothetical protein